MSGEDSHSPRRDLLLAAITDTEGTIRATDTKASIALVLHGLLFAGIADVTQNLGDTYYDACAGVQATVVLLLALFAAAFAGSVIHLLLCVAPAPPAAIPVVGSMNRGVFFVTSSETSRAGIPTMPSADEMRERVNGLDTPAILDELTSELLKVSAIRERKVAFIRRGIKALAAELLLALIYLIVIGALVV